MPRTTRAARSITRAGTGQESDGPDGGTMVGRDVGKFRILSQIGQGGMGVVYLAEHRGLSKRFAIKSLSRELSGNPNFRKRFNDEARRQAQVVHPNIVQVTDFFEEAGQFFLVMEYVDGQDLSRLINAKGKLSASESVGILRDILRGLGFAHATGLIHRDMKPSNVLLDKTGRALIMDFGIAILTGATEKGLTASGAAIGSPWYMSPEQIERPTEVDARSDIYAVGIVLYEMLTGDVPFDGDTDFSVQYQQIQTPPPDPRAKDAKIPREVAQIVLRAMAKDPVQRFQNCGEFLEAIRALDVPRSGRDWRWKAIAGTFAAMAVVSAGAMVYLSSRESPVVVPEPPANGTTPGPPSAQDEDARRKAEQQNAANVIRSASSLVSLTCTQLRELESKRLNLRAAELAKDGRHAEQFKQQVGEYRARADTALADYVAVLGQLASADGAIVADELAQYTKGLETRSDSKGIQAAGLMKAHYERYRASNAGVNASVVGADCEGVFGKATADFIPSPDTGATQRQIVYNVIQTGTEKALGACREFPKLKAKRDVGLQAAKDIQNTNLEEDLRNQIQQHSANIETRVSAYADFLRQLVKSDNQIVVEQFEAYRRSLEKLGKKEAFDQIQIARVMKEHYDRARGGGKAVDSATVIKDCEAALGARS